MAEGESGWEDLLSGRRSLQDESEPGRVHDVTVELFDILWNETKRRGGRVPVWLGRMSVTNFSPEGAFIEVSDPDTEERFRISVTGVRIDKLTE